MPHAPVCTRRLTRHTNSSLARLCTDTQTCCCSWEITGASIHTPPLCWDPGGSFPTEEEERAYLTSHSQKATFKVRMIRKLCFCAPTRHKRRPPRTGWMQEPRRRLRAEPGGRRAAQRWMHTHGDVPGRAPLGQKPAALADHKLDVRAERFS